MGRLRVSALALTEDALRPRAEQSSATEPPTLQFQQRVGFFSRLKALHICKAYTSLAEGLLHFCKADTSLPPCGGSRSAFCVTIPHS